MTPPTPQLPQDFYENLRIYVLQAKNRDHASPTTRACCQSNGQGLLPVCRVCFMDPIHVHAMTAPGKILDMLVSPGFLSTAINKKDCFGNTILHFYSANGQATFESLMPLLDAGVDPSHKNANGETFLHVLNPNRMQHQLYELFLDLKRRGFDLQERDIFGRTALHRLYEHDVPDEVCKRICRIFIESGVSQTMRDAFGRTPQEYLEALKGSREILTKVDPSLLAGITGRRSCMISPLNECAVALSNARAPTFLQWYFEAPELWLKSAEKFVNDPTFEEDDLGNNVFHLLAVISYFNNSYTPDFLGWLRRGGDPNHYNREGFTPLHTLMDLPLLDPDIDPDPGRTCRHLEMLLRGARGSSGNYDISRRADPELPTRFGETVLFLASYQGRVDCVSVLLRYGANIYARNHKGQSILTVCNTTAAFWTKEANDPTISEAERRNAAFLSRQIHECMTIIKNHGSFESASVI
ncbi:hypothetical protein ASPZODRAFT_2010302 [Penicilliopsis zonata CBS 506.65]|uniref:Ankyrin n=1 Tax=Penicilliopsis zonata CBS 506.65 TaxID=1073090 RepID=A0A1L9SHZ5_9EURO|nr:hypothetical protein ASPZODRAFT_2010302 [Penicilliopsis zonata CBS 506.65]OJJ46726.1 hypothetical protein ASPZODRAFT_2010302 [Penicilliopsis zonata CBS 506.65]